MRSTAPEFEVLCGDSKGNIVQGRAVSYHQGGEWVSERELRRLGCRSEYGKNLHGVAGKSKSRLHVDTYRYHYRSPVDFGQVKLDEIGTWDNRQADFRNLYATGSDKTCTLYPSTIVCAAALGTIMQLSPR